MTANDPPGQDGSATPGRAQPDGAGSTVLPERPVASARGRSRRRTAALVGLIALLGVLALTGVAYAVTDLPDPKAEAEAQVSVLQWSDGSELARVGPLDRTDVPLSKVSLDAQRAVLAAEDRAFYRQSGISFRGIARAVVANVKGGGVEQGASTITQQYVKNAFLTRERTFRRKGQEILIAVKLDRKLSKDEVLERYLNTVYFGRGAYGIEVAAQTYFDKPAQELTASQGAVLASLLRSPSGLDPARDPQAAKERWTYVLEGMAAEGWLETGVEAQDYPQVQPKQNRSNTLAGPQGYLVQQVQDELEAKGISEARLNSGGLRVRTTLDKRAQAAAVKAVQDVSGKKAPKDVHRALVAVEPGTGRIKAEYAGDDYVTRPFNDVTQGIAQAGSSFKPYALAAALEGGTSLKETRDGSSPQTFGDYEVRNFGDEQYGQIDLVEATVKSVNTIYVPLGQEAGLPRVADTAAALGVTADMSEESSFPSLSLGVTAVHPLDQAVAYAALAARGERVSPYIVEEVRGADGEVLLQARPEKVRALRTSVADDTSFALQQVVARGTGQAAQLDGRPAAGKTGTTNGNTAAWFVGYTPQLAPAVAVYSDDQDPPLRDLAGVAEVTGGTLPARTFKRFMDAALEGEPVLAFPPPQFGGEPVSSPSPTASPTLSPSPSASPSPSSSPSPSPVPPVEPSPLPEPSPVEPLPPLPPVEPSPSASPLVQPAARASPGG